MCTLKGTFICFFSMCFVKDKKTNVHMIENGEETLKLFGANVRKIREEKRLSLRKLSASCNINYSRIGQIESGKRNITLLTVIDLANGLEVPCAELFKWHLPVP